MGLGACRLVALPILSQLSASVPAFCYASPPLMYYTPLEPQPNKLVPKLLLVLVLYHRNRTVTNTAMNIRLVPQRSQHSIQASELAHHLQPYLMLSLPEETDGESYLLSSFF